MSHKTHAAPPVDHSRDHTHGHIVCEGLTVRPGGGMPGPSVSVIAGQSGSGIFVSTGREAECIELWAPAEGRPYLLIWDRPGKFPPPLAIDGEGLQLPDESGRLPDLLDGRAVVLSFADLLAAVRRKSE